MKSIPLLSATVIAMTLAGAAMAEDAHKAPHWDYVGDAGPGNWGTLDPAFATCGGGTVQSPIEIVDADAIPADLGDIVTSYAGFAPAVVNNGHTVQVNAPAGNGFEVENHKFELLQFHFHAPSEYRIHGKSYPLELHLVHKREDGALGVISVMFEEGAANPELDKVWANIPATIGEPATADAVSVDVNGLLPAERRYFRLMGSLTTPPCTEGVNWYLMDTPISASAEQIAAFAKLFPNGDARPIQVSNNRLVVHDSN